ncbi:MAG: hypothetical protein NTY06_04690 [Candidatus Gottesmanbacteria bacterium]|nr:hypothetical protein [Candidatus Gottesmanbacteria bacterium]
MKARITFWVGSLLLLLFLVYRLFFWVPEAPNPTFSTISNFDSVECLPWKRGWSGVWQSLERRSLRTWIFESDKKWLTKWIVVRNGKIYVGTYTGTPDTSDYINFDEVFTIADQKNETRILGFRVDEVPTPENIRFTTLILNKTKGILSISVNESSSVENENRGGYNEVYTCKEVPQSTLNGSKGLPQKQAN